MAHSSFFRKIRKGLKLAQYANKHNLSKEKISEIIQAGAHDPSRRKFLQQAGIASLTAIPAINLLNITKALAQQPNSKIEPITIIGAGAAGLAAAYQLKKAAVPFTIFEMWNRVGGRIMTQQNWNQDGQFIERGAELVDTNHYTLRGLAEELGIEIEDFTESDKGYVKELHFFNGQQYSYEQFVDACKPLIAKIEEANKELLGDSKEYLNAITFKEGKFPKAKEYDALSIAVFLEKIKQGTPAWVIDAINVAYECEFGMLTTEQNCFNLIDLIDTDFEDGFDMFGDSDESKRVKGGNEELTKKLKEVLELEAGKNIFYGAKLVEVRKNINGKVDCIFTHEGKTKVRSSARVICTVPFSVLREVKGFSKGAPLAGMSAEKIACINEIGYGMNTKMMMSFKTRFWRKDGKKAPKNTGVLYGDFYSRSFWETSRLQSGERGILTNFSGAKTAVEIANKGANIAYKQALDDLSKVYGADMVEKNYDNIVAVQPWPTMATVKGSYSAPKVGQLTTIWGFAATPELDNKLFFAGEHTHSLSWGFMNGGFNSGCRAANEVLTDLGMREQEIPGRHLVPKDAEDGDN